MTPVFLNGIRIPEASSRALMNAIGPLNGICIYCGGSTIEIKSVKMSPRTNPLFRIWCATCGRYGDLYNELPPELSARVLETLEIEIQRVF